MTRKTTLLLGAMAVVAIVGIPAIPSSAATLAKDFLTAPAHALTIKDPVAFQAFTATFSKSCTPLTKFVGDRTVGTTGRVTVTGLTCTGALGIPRVHVATAHQGLKVDQPRGAVTIATQ